MPTNNSWNSQDPAQVSKGGIGTNSMTAYNVVCGGTTGTAALQPVGSVGTSGQVLTSAGAGALPTWTTGGTGQGLVLLSTATASNSATIEFNTLINSTYKEYEVHILGATCTAAGASMRMRTSSNSGSSYDSGAANYGLASGLTATQITVSGASGNTAEKGLYGIVRLFDPSETSNHKMVSCQVSTVALATTGLESTYTHGSRSSTSVVNAIQFFYSSGNITLGTFRLYGVLT